MKNKESKERTHQSAAKIIIMKNEVTIMKTISGRMIKQMKKGKD